MNNCVVYSEAMEHTQGWSIQIFSGYWWYVHTLRIRSVNLHIKAGILMRKNYLSICVKIRINCQNTRPDLSISNLIFSCVAHSRVKCSKCYHITQKYRHVWIHVICTWAHINVCVQVTNRWILRTLYTAL